jgi:hypothetical protein
MVTVCRSSNAHISEARAGTKCTLCVLQVGQAVDYKESDIWWHGVVWAKSSGQLTIYLPGQCSRSQLPLTCMQSQAQIYGHRHGQRASRWCVQCQSEHTCMMTRGIALHSQRWIAP